MLIARVAPSRRSGGSVESLSSPFGGITPSDRGRVEPGAMAHSSKARSVGGVAALTARTTKPERPAVATQPAWSCCGGWRTARKLGPDAGVITIQRARLAAAAAANPAVDQRHSATLPQRRDAAGLGMGLVILASIASQVPGGGSAGEASSESG